MTCSELLPWVPYLAGGIVLAILSFGFGLMCGLRDGFTPVPPPPPPISPHL